MTSSRVGQRALDEPHRDRLNPGHPRYGDILAAHAGAMTAGDSHYLDPSTGLAVFTAAYLVQRGTCCGSGCRHCPYLDGR